MVGSRQLLATGLITERQLNHYADRGYITPAARRPDADSGTPRWYTKQEGEIALLIAKLGRLGLLPPKSAPLAREAVLASQEVGWIRSTIMLGEEGDEVLISIKLPKVLGDDA
jgi:hypothetical protein